MLHSGCICLWNQSACFQGTAQSCSIYAIIIIMCIIIILLDLLARFCPRATNKLSKGDSDARGNGRMNSESLEGRTKQFGL